MIKVSIHPGVCGNITNVDAVSEDGADVTLNVESGCEAVRKMFDELGDTFDSFELCFSKPGCGPLYMYASEHFPTHCGCPVISGVVKAVEAECKLALPRDVHISFEK